MAKYKITIDADSCIGCNVCQSLCEDVFDIDPDSGQGKVLKKEIGDDLIDQVTQAAQSCSMQAIKIEEIK